MAAMKKIVTVESDTLIWYHNHPEGVRFGISTCGKSWTVDNSHEIVHLPKMKLLLTICKN